MPVAWSELALYGAFLVVAFGLVPQPLAPATLLAAKFAAPWAVALVAAMAAALTACIDHVLVRRAFSLKRLQEVRQTKLFQRAEGWVKVAPFLTTTAFAGLPLPFLIVRVLLPLSGYPMGKYVLAVSVGRFGRIFVIAYVGGALDIPTPVLIAMYGIGIVAMVGAAIIRWRRKSLAVQSKSA